MISRKVTRLVGIMLIMSFVVGFGIVPLRAGLFGKLLSSTCVDAANVALAGNTTVVTQKWSRSGLPNNWEGGLVVGDVDNDGYEEIVYSGSGALYVLNPLTGLNKYPPYTRNDSSVGAIAQYCQPQMGDIDGDGKLEIVVPLYYHAGILVLRVNTTSNSLVKVWDRLVQATNAEGSCMSKPVLADINGDGKMEIYIASQDVEPNGGVVSGGNRNGAYNGTITGFYYNGTQFAQTFAWRSCSGGLSIGDPDHSGQYLVFMGDRGMYMGDGDYGGGCRCFYANNLTQKWYNPDFLCSSQAPVLVDVNNDGILDVVVSDQSRGIHILNSSNGAFMEPKNGFKQGLPVHYQLTVADIDGDGHMEALCNDGDHSQATRNGSGGSPDEMYVYDLTTFTVKSIISLGSPYNATTQKYNDPYNVSLAWNNKFSPLVADIYDNGNNPDGSPRMEIITGANTTVVNTNTNTSSYPASILIFDNNGNLLQNVTGWSAQIGYPFVQDIDKDGKLELIIMNSAGTVRVYDTAKTAPSERIRSEVTFFSEQRMGAAVPAPSPWNADVGPLLAPVNPGDDALAVSTSLQKLSFRLSHHQGKTMTYFVTSSPDIGSGIGSGGAGTYSISVTKTLQPYATYTWTVDASDGTYWNNRTYSFKTAFPTTGDTPPTQGAPSLSPQEGGNAFDNVFVCYNQSTADVERDNVSNLYKWYVNGTPLANVLMPFDTRNETVAKDYSGYGNDGVVHGATWVPNGIVGGAYSFDGGNDYIAVSDGGMGYYNNETTNPGYPAYHATLGGDGTWKEVTLENWIYMTSNTGSWLSIGKIPSYAIGFDRSTQKLFGGIWVWNFDNTNASNPAANDLIYTSTTEYTVRSNTTLQTNTWYDIVLTYKSYDGLRLYINGSLDSALLSTPSNPINGTIERSSGNPLYIGGYGIGYFQGLIDDVGIYPHAFSPQEVKILYQNAKDGSSNGSLIMPAGVGATPGSTLQCQVTPSDSQRDGNPRTSKSITLTSSQSTYVLNVVTVGNGSVKLNNTGPYKYGDVVQLTAVPASGWNFSSWSGDFVGVDNPITLSMVGNLSVTSVFANVSGTYVLNVVTVGNGSVKLNNTGPYKYGDVVQLTAVPASGWNFSSWSGNLTGTTNPTTLNITGNMYVTATFISQSYLYTGDFENGSFSGWTGTYTDSGQTSIVQTSTVQAGSYAAQFTTTTANERAYCYETLSGQSAVDVRFYVNLNSLPTSNYHVFVLRDDAGNNVANFQFVAGTQTKVRLYLYAGSSTYDANFNYATHSWYCIEVRIVRGTTNGNATVWINGNQMINAVNVKTDTGTTFGQFRFGHYYDDAGTVYIDSVVINSKYIGP